MGMQEFVQSILDTIDEKIRGMHTAFPGKIVSVDTGTGLATVQPAMKFTKPNGEKIDYPQISGVPILFPQGSGQGCTIAFPVKAGDGCLVIVAEQSLDLFLYDQETDTDLAFDLTNAICIPGLFSAANSAFQKACEQNSLVISNGGQSIAVGGGGISVTGNMTLNGRTVMTY